MKTSGKGIELIKKLEGCRLTAYPDGSGYSIGYGHHGVAAGQTISRQEAEELLVEDLRSRELIVDDLRAPLNQNQFDACVCLAYNIGSAAFLTSTAAELIKRDPTPRAELEEAWKLWNKSGKETMSSLVSRRDQEYELYSSPVQPNPLKVIATLASGLIVITAILIILLK